MYIRTCKYIVQRERERVPIAIYTYVMYIVATSLCEKSTFFSASDQVSYLVFKSNSVAVPSHSLHSVLLYEYREGDPIN